MARNSDVEAKAKAWLDDKGKSLTCAACGAKQWTADEAVSMPKSKKFPGPTQASPDRYITTVVPFVCENCGYIAFVKAKTMGLDVPDAE